MGESERVEGHDSERGRGRGVCLRERVNSSEEEEGEEEKRKFWDAGLNSTQKTSYFFQVPELFYETDMYQS